MNEKNTWRCRKYDPDHCDLGPLVELQMKKIDELKDEIQHLKQQIEYWKEKFRKKVFAND